MTDEQFIKIWHEKDTTQAVAEAVGQTYLATAQRASRLRKKGANVPSKRKNAEWMAKISPTANKGKYEQ